MMVGFFFYVSIICYLFLVGERIGLKRVLCDKFNINAIFLKVF